MHLNNYNKKKKKKMKFLTNHMQINKVENVKNIMVL